mmetsp:Transcript_25968/g.60621  ORF Transcript_25968/g.60621 Transcript_25968/m.60621 type:complete len:432 (+) Transcript_25968:1003-2298(+)
MAAKTEQDVHPRVHNDADLGRAHDVLCLEVGKYRHEGPLGDVFQHRIGDLHGHRGVEYLTCRCLLRFRFLLFLGRRGGCSCGIVLLLWASVGCLGFVGGRGSISSRIIDSNSGGRSCFRRGFRWNGILYCCSFFHRCCCGTSILGTASSRSIGHGIDQRVCAVSHLNINRRRSNRCLLYRLYRAVSGGVQHRRRLVAIPRPSWLLRCQVNLHTDLFGRCFVRLYRGLLRLLLPLSLLQRHLERPGPIGHLVQPSPHPVVFLYPPPVVLFPSLQFSQVHRQLRQLDPEGIPQLLAALNFGGRHGAGFGQRAAGGGQLVLQGGGVGRGGEVAGEGGGRFDVGEQVGQRGRHLGTDLEVGGGCGEEGGDGGGAGSSSMLIALVGIFQRSEERMRRRHCSALGRGHGLVALDRLAAGGVPRYVVDQHGPHESRER